MRERNRIAFAWWLEGSDFASRNYADLEERGEKVPPSEYEEGMKHNIYCPVCYMPLFRSPLNERYLGTSVSLDTTITPLTRQHRAGYVLQK